MKYASPITFQLSFFQSYYFIIILLNNNSDLNEIIFNLTKGKINIEKYIFGNKSENYTKSILKKEKFKKIFQKKKGFFNKFKDFPSIFKNKIRNINLDGFNKGLRNLEEYNLLDIEEILNLIENKYEAFRQKISTYNKYDNILTQKSGFYSVTFNSTSTLTNDFDAYRHLITQYTNNSQIDEYFRLLEESAEEIRNKVITFYIHCSNEINYSINIIYNGMRDSWYEIRKEINPLYI